MRGQTKGVSMRKRLNKKEEQATQILLTGDDKKIKQYIKTITQKLIAEKKKTNYFNVGIKDKGIEFVMAITAYDSKPFAKKDVNITAFLGGQQKLINVITPAKAGYTKKAFDEYIN